MVCDSCYFPVLRLMRTLPPRLPGVAIPTSLMAGRGAGHPGATPKSWMAGSSPAMRSASEPHDGVAAAIGLIINAAAAPHDIAIAVDANATAGQGADIGAGADDPPGSDAGIGPPIGATADHGFFVDAAPRPPDDGPLVGAAGPPHHGAAVTGCLGTLDQGAVLHDPADIAVDETAGGEGEARQADAQ